MVPIEFRALLHAARNSVLEANRTATKQAEALLMKQFIPSDGRKEILVEISGALQLRVPRSTLVPIAFLGMESVRMEMELPLALQNGRLMVLSGGQVTSVPLAFDKIGFIDQIGFEAFIFSEEERLIKELKRGI